MSKESLSLIAIYAETALGAERHGLRPAASWPGCPDVQVLCRWNGSQSSQPSNLNSTSAFRRYRQRVHEGPVLLLDPFFYTPKIERNAKLHAHQRQLELLRVGGLYLHLWGEPTWDPLHRIQSLPYTQKPPSPPQPGIRATLDHLDLRFSEPVSLLFCSKD